MDGPVGYDTTLLTQLAIDQKSHTGSQKKNKTTHILTLDVEITQRMSIIVSEELHKQLSKSRAATNLIN